MPTDFFPIHWHGHWIWVPEEPIAPAGFWSSGIDPQAPAAHGLFRKTFMLDTVPDQVPARMTADSRYLLFVNGQEVARGPIRSQPRRMYYDFFDLAPFLQQGENLLAVHVVYYGKSTSFWMPAVPNNTLGQRGALVFEARLGTTWLVSDATWRARKSTAWAETGRDGLAHGGGVPVEVFDARCLANNWQMRGFDDQHWGMAHMVPATHIGGHARSQPPGDPYGALLPRPIAALGGAFCLPASMHVDVLAEALNTARLSPIVRVQQAIRLPVQVHIQAAAFPITIDIPAQGMARLSLDMGRIVSGLVTIELHAPAGTVFDLSYTEDAMRSDFSMDKMSAGMQYTARGEQDNFQAFDSNGLRYIYALIHGNPGPVTITKIGVRELHYPWEGQASFACSDAELNRIFQAGLRTVQLCSHDAFIDCPTREQRAWVGDGVVHQMVQLATNSDWRLARHFLTLGNSPRSDGILPMSVVGEIEASGLFTIPDWSLHWLHGVYNWYRYAGEHDTIADLLPTARRILAWYAPYQTETGVLKDVPEWNLVDWSAISVRDTSAAITALWARGLREYAEMSAWLEERASQRWAEARYARIQAGFEQFWDERRGVYVDHIVDGQQCPELNQISGALAIVAGLAPRERWQRIARTISDPQRTVVRSWLGTGNGEQSMDKWQAQVREGRYDITWDVEREIVLAEPFMSYVVHDAIAQAGCAELLPNLYRRWSQFLADGYDTLGECWDFGTHVHGWSCTPTRDMVFYTLGVTPAEPGFGVARIAPQPGGLAWLKGSAPTPHGPIHVELQGDELLIDSPVPVEVTWSGKVRIRGATSAGYSKEQ